MQEEGKRKQEKERERERERGWHRKTVLRKYNILCMCTLNRASYRLSVSGIHRQSGAGNGWERVTGATALITNDQSHSATNAKWVATHLWLPLKFFKLRYSLSTYFAIFRSLFSLSR